jgi:hypothetical protein
MEYNERFLGVQFFVIEITLYRKLLNNFTDAKFQCEANFIRFFCGRMKAEKDKFRKLIILRQ